eukprot:GHVR01165640.1.p1 GENE.GHVR01165640.1~~GHVR01165640.1.p1  ORF type:complete len:226 (+),score=33.15 GHVR01165640.1:84-761(+)
MGSPKMFILLVMMWCNVIESANWSYYYVRHIDININNIDFDGALIVTRSNPDEDPKGYNDPSKMFIAIENKKEEECENAKAIPTDVHIVNFIECIDCTLVAGNKHQSEHIDYNWYEVGNSCAIYEYPSGGTVTMRLLELTSAEKFKVMKDALIGLHQLHIAGFIHRELRLQNMMFDHNNNIHLYAGPRRTIKEDDSSEELEYDTDDTLTHTNPSLKFETKQFLYM